MLCSVKKKWPMERISIDQPGATDQSIHRIEGGYSHGILHKGKGGDCLPPPSMPAFEPVSCANSQKAKLSYGSGHRLRPCSSGIANAIRSNNCSRRSISWMYIFP